MAWIAANYTLIKFPVSSSTVAPRSAPSRLGERVATYRIESIEQRACVCVPYAMEDYFYVPVFWSDQSNVLAKRRWWSWRWGNAQCSPVPGKVNKGKTFAVTGLLRPPVSRSVVRRSVQCNTCLTHLPDSGQTWPNVKPFLVA